jgi:hypothetical protein
LARLRRWRDFQEARAQAEHLRREGERIGCEREVARTEDVARAAQQQRTGLLDAPELDLARLHEGASIEAHAWRAVSRATQALDEASEVTVRARQQHLDARQASRVVAQRDDRRMAEDASRREKTTFDQIADLLAARRTSR